MPVYAVFADEVIWIQLYAQVQVHGWCIWVVVFPVLLYFVFCVLEAALVGGIFCLSECGRPLLISP